MQERGNRTTLTGKMGTLTEAGLNMKVVKKTIKYRGFCRFWGVFEEIYGIQTRAYLSRSVKLFYLWKHRRRV